MSQQQQHQQQNRPYCKPEIRSKIGDYIRGKISAQSLMHPSRFNARPIDKRNFTLNAPNYHTSSAFGVNAQRSEYHTYQRRVRRPPLKDYIEGRAKLCDMISPSKIVHIPKERKYHPEFRSYADHADEAARTHRTRGVSFEEMALPHAGANPPNASFKVGADGSLRAAAAAALNVNFNGAVKTQHRESNGEWCLTTYQPPAARTGRGPQSGGAPPVQTELTLIPLRSTSQSNSGGGGGKRKKVMCRIKRVQKGNPLTNGKDITEERIIEVPESLLRNKKNVPKFLMDKYNIPCTVGTKGGEESDKREEGGGGGSELAQLAIWSAGAEKVSPEGANRTFASPPCHDPRCTLDDEPFTDTEESTDSEPGPHRGRGENSSHQLVLDAVSWNSATAAAAPTAAAAAGSQHRRRRNGGPKGGGGGPTEQGDHDTNTTTTYIFEFFEESDAKSAIIEEVDEDGTGGAERVNGSGGPKPYHYDHPRPDTYYVPRHGDSQRLPRASDYEDNKSQILLQRELLDLHRGMLKCDKNVMGVEQSVSQMVASLNSVQTVQNQEIRPIVMNMKNDQDTLRSQVKKLESENVKLRSTLKMVRRKTVNYEKLIYFVSQANNNKIQELESKVQTITQAHVKSIEMQNVYNKNMFKITHQMKRTYSELDSRFCCSSFKSSKNSNSSDVSNKDLI